MAGHHKKRSTLRAAFWGLFMGLLVVASGVAAMQLLIDV
jgi:hypothetical protein